MGTTPLQKEISDAYLEEARGPKPTGGPVTSRLFDLRFQGKWDDIWQIILGVAGRDEIIDTETLVYIAAGPLEDLICNVGSEYIDRVEREAKFNRQFGKLLTGVWLGRAEPEVRARVVQFCRAFPDPIDGEYQY